MLMGVLRNGPYTKKTVTIYMTAKTLGPHDFAWNPELFPTFAGFSPSFSTFHENNI